MTFDDPMNIYRHNSGITMPGLWHHITATIDITSTRTDDTRS